MRCFRLRTAKGNCCGTITKEQIFKVNKFPAAFSHFRSHHCLRMGEWHMENPSRVRALTTHTHGLELLLTGSTRKRIHGDEDENKIQEKNLWHTIESDASERPKKRMPCFSVVSL